MSVQSESEVNKSKIEDDIHELESTENVRQQLRSDENRN